MTGIQTPAAAAAPRRVRTGRAPGPQDPPPADPPPRTRREPRTPFLPRLLADLGLTALGVLAEADRIKDL